MTAAHAGEAGRTSLTVAIPVYNEEATLEPLVREAARFLDGFPEADYEILVVDDGSRDRSPAIAARLASEIPRVRVFRHEQNQGFSGAQRSAYRQAEKDWVFILPADGQIRVQELEKFLPLCSTSDLVLGRRILRMESLAKVLFSRLYYRVVQNLFGIPFADFGACWMVRRRLHALTETVSRTPVASTELLIKALMGGARIREVWVYEYPRAHGTAKGSKMVAQIPRILADLRRLYRAVHDPAHPYHVDPHGYQRRFREAVTGEACVSARGPDDARP